MLRRPVKCQKLASAVRLAEEGARVLITGRTEATLKEAAAIHENISYLVADVSKPEQAKQAVETAVSQLGKLDVLFNNAGIAKFAPLSDANLDHFDEHFNTNVRGLFHVSQLALPHLIQSKGVIISNASVVGEDPMPEASVYSASKAAVIAMSKSWAQELAPQGVRVNVVSPGPIETPIFGKTGMNEQQIQEMAGHILSAVPMGRMGQPEEIAGAVAYLASDDASYVTGAERKVDGGMAA